MGLSMTATDLAIRWSTAVAVIGVAAVASYEHAHDLVREHGEVGGRRGWSRSWWTA